MSASTRCPARGPFRVFAAQRPAGLPVGPWPWASQVVMLGTREGSRAVTWVPKAAAVLLLATTSACAVGRDHPPVSDTPSASQLNPLATDSSDSPGINASSAASSAVRAYFATVDQVRQDAKRPETDLEAVASSTQLTAQKRLLKNQRESGRRQVGDTKVVDVSVESVSLDDPATAYIDVCWDVTGVDILDADGKSVVTDGRKDVGWTRFVVTNPAWETAPTDGWRVSSGSDLEKEPCAAS